VILLRRTCFFEFTRGRRGPDRNLESATQMVRKSEGKSEGGRKERSSRKSGSAGVHMYESLGHYFVQ
jgi:hypothetical protein